MSVNSPGLPALFLLVSLCLPVFSQSESTARKNTDEPESGPITGKVVNEMGQPLAGASVFVRAANTLTLGRTTTSDADGNFRIGGLEAALYSVFALAPAYTSGSGDLGMPITHYRIGDNVRVEMVRGGAITGTVTNGAGEPVIEVRVRAVMIRDAKGQTGTQSLAINEQPTDDRGVYRIWGLAPGTYLVSAGGASYAQVWQFNPYDSDSPTYSPSATRDTAAEVTVRGGEDSTADIRYRAEPGYVVSGTVKSVGQNGATINLIPAGGGVMPTGTYFLPPGSQGFAFNGVGDGDYDLVAQQITTVQSASMPFFAYSDPKRVTVRGANVTGIELITKPLPSLSGRITLEPSTIEGCKGKRPPRFAEALVKLQRPEKEVNNDHAVYLRVFGGSTSPDKHWAFAFNSLMPGKYQFEPQFYARYWYVRSITLGAIAAATAKSQPAKTDAAANWTALKTGDQLTNLTITLAEGAASIRGRLTIAEDAAVPPSSVVYLVPSEQDKAEDVLRFFVTEIAADGTFALNNLPPGKYWSLAQINNEAQISTLAKLRQPEAAAARTKLRRVAENHKTEVELKPCQNLPDYQIGLKN